MSLAPFSHVHLANRLAQRILLLAVVSFLAAPSISAADGTLYEGMTRAEVIEALGRPDAIAAMGEREIFQYASGARVEIHSGMLYSARGIHIHAAPPPGIQSSPEPTPTPASTPAAANAEPVLSSTPSQAPPSPSPQPTPIDPDEQERPLYPPLTWEEHSDDLSETWVFATIEVLIRGIFIAIMLKISFSVVGMPLLLIQNLRITVGYILVSLGLVLIPWAGEVREFFYINAGLRFMALCSLIYACSDVREGLTVLKIALTTAIVSLIMTFVLMLGILYIIGLAL